MTRSETFGTVFMAFGLIPFLLWVAGIVGLVPQITEWPIVFMTVAMEGLGWMIYRGKGESVGDAFLSWFNKKNADDET